MKFAYILNTLIARYFPRHRSLPETPEDTAKRLLLAHLTREQQKELKALGRFTVRGNVTKFEYWVHPLHSYNVTRVHDGKWLCAIPRDSLRMPIGDVMLTMKLTIENDEQEFIRAARGAHDAVTPVPPPSNPDCTLPNWAHPDAQDKTATCTLSSDPPA